MSKKASITDCTPKSNKENEIEIAPGYSISEAAKIIFVDMDDRKSRERLADMLSKRLYCRYLNPIYYKKCTDEKSGFVMMAISCMLIETIYSFWEGIDNTRRKGKTAFRKFFREFNDIFSEFGDCKENIKENADCFYENIRCGLLHQTEPTGGWKIRRDCLPCRKCQNCKSKKCINHDKNENELIAIDFKKKIVQANIFVYKIEKAITKFIKKVEDNKDTAIKVAKKFCCIMSKHN